MPLAYYSRAAEARFWSEHWGGHSVDEMIGIARESPLTTLVLDGLAGAPGRRVLEAGCGLGQYVLLLRDRGFAAAGVDWSEDALRACRVTAAVPLARMDLRALAIRDASFDACVSLGVVEHDAAGPDAILAEMARVLVRGGVLVASVPYWNGVRRATAPWVMAQNHAARRRGGAFYQYAFTRAEFLAALVHHGFVVHSTTPYDPARILRRLVPRRGRPARPRHVRERQADGKVSPASGGVPAVAARRDTPAPRDRGWRSVIRRAIHSRAALALLGHMILAVAVKR